MKTKIKINEVFDESYIQLVESSESEKDPMVDGENIIGKFKGWLLPHGFSRNKRHYSPKVRQKVRESKDFQTRLKNGLMFGTIGHYKGPVNDSDLSEGKVSHKVQDIQEDGNGYGYIFNTPAGRNLKVYLGGGCKLKTSTRGEGVFKEGVYETNEENEKCPSVDEESYICHGIDFVIEPGFLETNPELIEQLENIEEKKVTKGENIMDWQKYAEELKEEIKNLKTKLNSLEESVKSTEKASNEKDVTIKTLTEENSKLKSVNESFEKLEKPADKIQEALKNQDDLIEQYKEKVGTLEEVAESEKIVTKIVNMLEAYKKEGSLEEIKKIKASSEKLIEKYEAYEELGSVEELEKIKSLSEKLLENIDKKSNISESKVLSKKYNKPIEIVAKLVEKLGAKEAEETLKTLIENKNVKVKSKASTKIVESEDSEEETGKTIKNESLAKRLAKSQGLLLENVQIGENPSIKNSEDDKLAALNKKIDDLTLSLKNKPASESEEDDEEDEEYEEDDDDIKPASESEDDDEDDEEDDDEDGEEDEDDADNGKHENLAKLLAKKQQHLFS